MKDEDVRTLVKLVEQRLVINTERLGRFEERFERNEARMEAQDRAHSEQSSRLMADIHKIEVTIAKLMTLYSFVGVLIGALVSAAAQWLFKR